MATLHLLAIVGSLRSGSVHAAAARTAADLVGDGVALTIRDVSDIPLFNGDDEVSGPPAAVVSLSDEVAACDGVVLFSPEYNSSFPAVTKNVIDWLSRPPRAWAGTPIALVSLTPGPRAGLGLREHFSAIMARQPTRLYETLGLGNSGDRIGPDGELSDEATRIELAEFLTGFVQFCRSDG